jgi:hypothetical protein
VDISAWPNFGGRLRLCDDSNVPEGSAAALYLLTTAMEQWQDDMLYASLLVKRDDEKSQTSHNKPKTLMDQVGDWKGRVQSLVSKFNQVRVCCESIEE